MKPTPRNIVLAIAFIIAAILVAIASGCSSIHGTKTLPDGSTLKLSSTRWLWASEGIQTTITDSNGLSFSLTIQKSNPDAQTVAAAVSAAVQAAKSP